MFSQLERLEDDFVTQDTPLKSESTNNFSFILDDDELLECFLNLPDAVDLPFALDKQQISQRQQNKPALWQQQMAHPLQYPKQHFGNIRVLSFQPAASFPWKICIPTQQLEDVINWFHFALNHCGLHWLITHLYHPRLRSVAERVTKNCDACQREKLPGPQYGYMPPGEANILLWEEVALDLIGPWMVKSAVESYGLYALTCINTVTNFPDAICLCDKTASHVGMQFKNLWLSRYPRPVCCLHDRGTEFMGADFQRIYNDLESRTLQQASVSHSPTLFAKDYTNR
jgi:hypothetical protein